MRPLEMGGLVTRGDEKSWALFSKDDKYRYALGRRLPAGVQEGLFAPRIQALHPSLTKTEPLPLVFFMLNPSTADHTEDDPTVKNCIAFATRAGARDLVVLNLFAYRATDPAELRRVDDPVGRVWNDAVTTELLGVHTAPLTGAIVCAWGKLHGALRYRTAYARKLLAGREALCLGVNLDGSPKHPLYLAHETKLVRFTLKETPE